MDSKPELFEKMRHEHRRDEGELKDAVAYIDWKQGFYDDVLSGKTEYYSNLIHSTSNQKTGD